MSQFFTNGLAPTPDTQTAAPTKILIKLPIYTQILYMRILLHINLYIELSIDMRLEDNSFYSLKDYVRFY